MCAFVLLVVCVSTLLVVCASALLLCLSALKECFLYIGSGLCIASHRCHCSALQRCVISFASVVYDFA